MIITRTPYRVSFFGGGTDYPAWYLEHGGAVVGTAIDKYCFIMCRYLPPFFPHKHRIVYSRTEYANAIAEIEHPAVRACLEFLDMQAGMELHHNGDLPARSGMGTSSSFTVGLLHALYALQGRMVTKMRLVWDAIKVEQDILKENVGSQDQTLACLGGFNRIDFFPDGRIIPTPVVLPAQRVQELQSHLMLVYTGLSRYSSEIAAEQIQAAHAKAAQLTAMHQMVDEAVNILTSGTDIREFGVLMHEAWQVKRQLSSRITTSDIDDLYDTGREAGAVGGKLLGAGGGGFFLLFAPPAVHGRIRERLSHAVHVPFAFTPNGSQVIYYENGDHGRGE